MNQVQKRLSQPIIKSPTPFINRIFKEG